MVVLVILIMCAGICGHLARQKNRPVAQWVIVGFLGGIIALFVILVLPEKEEEDGGL